MAVSVCNKGKLSIFKNLYQELNAFSHLFGNGVDRGWCRQIVEDKKSQIDSFCNQKGVAVRDSFTHYRAARFFMLFLIM